MSRTRIRRLVRLLAWTWALGVALVVVALATTAILGYRVVAVHSESMKPTLDVGSAIVIDDVAIDEVEEGDVVVFNHPRSNRSVLHRVVGVEQVGSSIGLITRGDANPADDLTAVTSGELKGRMVLALPWLRPVVLMVTTSVGMLVLLSVPLVLFIIDWILGRLGRAAAPAGSLV